MINSDDMRELKEICNKLSPNNLQYVKAVANALKFTEIKANSQIEAKSLPKNKNTQ